MKARDPDYVSFPLTPPLSLGEKTLSFQALNLKTEP